MTDTHNEAWADGLIELLDHQRHVYYELRELSEQQAELVAAGEASSLLGILSQRQQLIDQLAQLNGRIDPYRRDWPTVWSRLDGETQEQIQSLLSHVQQLLDAVVSQDGRDRKVLGGADALSRNDSTANHESDG